MLDDSLIERKRQGSRIDIPRVQSKQSKNSAILDKKPKYCYTESASGSKSAKIHSIKCLERRPWKPESHATLPLLKVGFKGSKEGIKASYKSMRDCFLRTCGALI